jgi:hypothetical protein
MVAPLRCKTIEEVQTIASAGCHLSLRCVFCSRVPAALCPFIGKSEKERISDGHHRLTPTEADLAPKVLLLALCVSRHQLNYCRLLLLRNDNCHVTQIGVLSTGEVYGELAKPAALPSLVDLGPCSGARLALHRHRVAYRFRTTVTSDWPAAWQTDYPST